VSHPKRQRNQVQPFHPQVPQIRPSLQHQLLLLQQLQELQQYQQQPIVPQHVYPPPVHYRRRRAKHKEGGNVVAHGMIAFMLSWGWCAVNLPGLTMLTWVGIAAYWISHMLRWRRK